MKISVDKDEYGDPTIMDIVIGEHGQPSKFLVDVTRFWGREGRILGDISVSINRWGMTCVEISVTSARLEREQNRTIKYDSGPDRSKPEIVEAVENEIREAIMGDPSWPTVFNAAAEECAALMESEAARLQRQAADIRRAML